MTSAEETDLINPDPSVVHSRATASMAKCWCTDLQFKVLDACVQLHGGYGYMRGYPIARAH